MTVQRTELRPRTAEVVALRPLGEHHLLSLAVASGSDPSALARPGQFLLFPPGPGAVLGRTRWVVGEHAEPGFGTAVEVVVPPSEDVPEPGEVVTVLGPLGRGFRAPVEPLPVVVVGQGAGQAVAHWLTAQLAGRGCRVHVVLVADQPEDHLDVSSARRGAASVLLTDGTPAAVTDALAGLVRDRGAAALYAVVPGPLTARLGSWATSLGLPAQLAAFPAGRDDRCGTGLCGACAVPLHRGPVRWVRPCLDGPVLRADLVDWGRM